MASENGINGQQSVSLLHLLQQPSFKPQLQCSLTITNFDYHRLIYITTYDLLFCDYTLAPTILYDHLGTLGVEHNTIAMEGTGILSCLFFILFFPFYFILKCKVILHNEILV